MVGRYDTGDQTDLIAQIADLRARLDRLERTPQIGATSIDSGDLTIMNGSIIVKDAAGNVRVQMGKLPDGNYDIAAFSADGLSTVNLAALAFGPVGAFDTTNCTSPINLGAWADPLTGNPGPSVTVNIGSSGRCKVTLSAYLDYTVLPVVSPNGAQLNMTYLATGANTIAATIERAVGDYLTDVSNTTAFHRVARIGRTNYHSGLNPGSTTFKCVYLAQVDVGSTLTHGFADRSIIVEPF